MFEPAIVPGQQYLLDGKILVKVIKPINRSSTVFSVETPGQSVVTVERARLFSVNDSDAVILHDGSSLV